jgi:hypothetical protein
MPLSFLFDQTGPFLAGGWAEFRLIAPDYWSWFSLLVGEKIESLIGHVNKRQEIVKVITQINAGHPKPPDVMVLTP